MKKSILFFLALFILPGIYAQDTISTNIYQKNSKLGIGISEPNAYLTVINDSSYMDYHTNTLIADFRRIYNSSTARFQIYGFPNSDLLWPHVKSSVMLYATEDAKDLILCATKDTGKIRFFTGTWSDPNSERMRITADGNIGIGTTLPETKLRIEDNVSDGNNRALIRLRNLNSGNKSSVSLALESYDQSSGASFSLTSSTYNSIPDFSDMAAISTNGRGFSVYSTSNYGSIRFYTNMNQDGIIERMRIDSAGNVGIGVKKPSAKLQVTNGDIYISSIEKGIIMKSPNGNCWRGTLDESGNLNFVVIDCPDATKPPTQNPYLIQENSGITISPNPAGDIVTIKNTDSFENLTLKIYTIDGILLEKIPIIDKDYVKDISMYAKCIYIFQIEDRKGNLKAVERIVKK